MRMIKTANDVDISLNMEDTRGIDHKIKEAVSQISSDLPSTCIVLCDVDFWSGIPNALVVVDDTKSGDDMLTLCYAIKKMYDAYLMQHYNFVLDTQVFSTRVYDISEETFYAYIEGNSYRRVYL